MQKDSPVLLVDSSATLLLLERTLLARRGWRIEAASTAAQAEAILVREVPALILCSDHLPDGSGYDLCRRVRGDARTSSVPFLFVLGRRDESVLEACRCSGATEVLFKPLRGTDVDSLINQIFGLSFRRWERRNFHTLVAIEQADGVETPPRWVSSVNITPDGMAVEAEPSDTPIPTGSHIRILFYVPTHHEPITGEVEVVWHRPLDRKIRYGLRFVRLVPGGIQRIATFGGFAMHPNGPQPSFSDPV
jgi:CheY-like chemotaxis protein